MIYGGCERAPVTSQEVGTQPGGVSHSRTTTGKRVWNGTPRRLSSRVGHREGAAGRWWERCAGRDSADIPYLFHTLTSPGLKAPTTGRVTVADAMVGLLTRLASAGDPNGSGEPNIPMYTPEDPYLTLAEPIAPGAGLRTAECDFWDRLPDSHRGP
jgi:hypothetical protein